MNDSLAAQLSQLITLSRRYGSDPAFVLAGGGNTSFKTADRLWIKASGHALATIDADGFVELDRTKLDAILHGTWPTGGKAREGAFIDAVMASRVHPDLGQRPSVEALLHHLLPWRFVVHTHPALINGLTCCVTGCEIANELFGDRVLWQPYVDPGLILAKQLESLVNLHRVRTGHDPAAIFLANHGLVVGGDTPEAIDAETLEVVTRLQARLDRTEPTVSESTLGNDLLEIYARGLLVEHHGLSSVIDSSGPARILATVPELCAAALAGPLTPDQIVYCRSLPVHFESPSTDMPTVITQWRTKWNAYASRYGWEPWIAIVAGAGLIAYRNKPSLSEVSRAVYADAARVYDYAHRFGGVRVLNAQERSFIEEWEVEAYRRAVLSK